MLPVLLQLARRWLERKAGIGGGGAQQFGEVGRGLAVGRVEGRPEAGVAGQYGVRGTAPDLRLAHEVERVADDGQAAPFAVGGADRLRRAMQHDVHGPAQRHEEQHCDQGQFLVDVQARHQALGGAEKGGHRLGWTGRKGLARDWLSPRLSVAFSRPEARIPIILTMRKRGAENAPHQGKMHAPGAGNRACTRSDGDAAGALRAVAASVAYRFPAVDLLAAACACLRRARGGCTPAMAGTASRIASMNNLSLAG